MASTFHVSICGGGIGGLTLALVIGKYGKHAVEIFEADPTITTIGAGITFCSRTLDIMKELGLYDDIVKMAVKPPSPLENTESLINTTDITGSQETYQMPFSYRKIFSGMHNYERNTGTMHPVTVKQSEESELGTRGTVVPLRPFGYM